MLSSSSTSSGIESDESDYEHRPFYCRCRSRYYIIEHLVQEFTSYDEDFEELFGMSRNSFNYLKSLILRDIKTNHTYFRHMRPIRPRDRLGICLRFLTSGSSFELLSLTYDLQSNIIETIVLEVCNTIVERLQPLAMPYPTKPVWRNIMLGFQSKFSMPNCLGALNGRNITVMKDKKFVLLCLVDINQKFIMADISYNGDGPEQDVWDMSQMGAGFSNNLFNVPPNRKPPRYAHPLPYVIIAGSSFRPKPYMISKYKDEKHVDTDANRVFDCRINVMKKSADLAVARLRRRWQVIRSNIPVPLAMAKVIVTTTCCLENYFSVPDVFAKISMRKLITRRRLFKMRRERENLPEESMTLKDRYLKYFLGYGQVPWQYNLLD